MLTLEARPTELKQEPHTHVFNSTVLKLDITPLMPISNNQFFEFCQQNRDLRIELTKEGELVIMSPAGGGSSRSNARITQQLTTWAIKDGSGESFDSSGGFILPNGAVRSPDASWVSNEQLKTLSKKDWEKFLPLCPEFVIELRSASDSLRELQKKMVEYIDNGAQLTWLIDPKEKRVYVYTPSDY